MQKNIILFFATGGGVGFIPGAPGTYGTLVGVLLFWGLRGLPPSNYLVFVSAFFALALWTAIRAEILFNRKDCQKIVIDEITGYLVTMLFLPTDFKMMVAGFLAFRFLDILKPFPISAFERRFKGGWGIVGDDVLAGILANAVLQIVVRFKMM